MRGAAPLRWGSPASSASDRSERARVVDGFPWRGDSGTIQEVVRDRWPIGPVPMTEFNPRTGEPVSAVVGPVVNEEVTVVQVLVMREDQPLGHRRYIPKVLAHPEILIRPR